MRQSIKRSLVAGAGIAALAGAGVLARELEPSRAEAQAAASNHTAQPFGVDLADVAEKVVGSVVNIATTSLMAAESGPFGFDPFFNDPSSPFDGSASEREVHSLGSGVVINATGRILTNSHVVKNASDIRIVLNDGAEYEAKVLGTDPKSDLAVLQIQGDYPKLTPITWGDSTKLRVGDPVLAVGNPFGVGQAVTMGIVSAKGRANVGIAAYEDFIQTDAAINPGNSGGALVDMDGHLIGINTAILSKTGGYQGIGFAIPTNMASPIVDALVKNGKVSRGWLGISIETVTADLAKAKNLAAKHGVLVDGLLDDGPAAKAGLKKGDIIVAIDGIDTPTGGELRNAVATAGAAKKVTVGYLRDGNRDDVTVKLGELPEDPVAIGTVPQQLQPQQPQIRRWRRQW